MSEFLLEVGVEEIPDWMIDPALADFERRFVELLEKFDLREGASVETFATPRRLVLVAQGLAAKQRDRRETLYGPPASAAYDASGAPAKPALGFAKRAGVEPSDLKTGDDGKLYVERAVAGRQTADVLAEGMPDVILGVRFPKTMYWTGKNGPRFIRPIRRLVALLDGRVVPFEIAGVVAAATTPGHRRLGRGEFTVASAADYKRKLSENGVVLAAADRRRMIAEGCERAFPPGGGRRARLNERLLRVLVNLTEHPTVIRGDFDENFLELPDEVLETVMFVHQKYFAVEEVAASRLANSFLAVADLDGDPEGEIRRGNERVLRARFNDARFFWENDQKRPLSARLEDLAAVTFQAELGSYRDKVERMRGLVGELGAAAGVDEAVRRAAERAAQLSKCDLTTEMVGEFPELQGVVGGLYAAAQGEPSEVAEAVYDHYKPTGVGDGIPRGSAGRLVAVADKLDTLGGLFRIGKLPTGSRDPFALRRAAYGIVRVLIEGALPITLDQLADAARAGERRAELREFFVERLRHYLGEAGFRYDEINAVLAASDAQPLDVERRCRTIADARSSADFEPLAAGFRRIRNILDKAGGVELSAANSFDESRLEAGAERALFEAYAAARDETAALKDRGDYAAALTRIAALRPTVDRFFDDVLVMAPDERVRANRLALLARLLEEFSTIADFSEIAVGEGGATPSAA